MEWKQPLYDPTVSFVTIPYHFSPFFGGRLVAGAQRVDLPGQVLRQEAAADDHRGRHPERQARLRPGGAQAATW